MPTTRFGLEGYGVRRAGTFDKVILADHTATATRPREQFARENVASGNRSNTQNRGRSNRQRGHNPFRSN